jgi:hypothetical protein
MTTLSPRSNLQTRPIEDSVEILVCHDTPLALSVASTLILSAADSARLIVVSKTKYTPGLHYRALIQSGIIPKPQPAPPLPRVVAISYDWPDGPASMGGKPDALLATLEASFLDGYDWAVIDLTHIDPDSLSKAMRGARERVPADVAVLFLCGQAPEWLGPHMTITDGILTVQGQRYAIRPETVVLSPFRENGHPVSVEVHNLQELDADGQIRFTPLPWL